MNTYTDSLTNKNVFPSNTLFKSRVLEILVVALVYILSARIGQFFSIPPGNVTPVWLPSGIMIGLCYIYGPRIWPGIFLGAFIGNAWAYFTVESTSLAFQSLFAGRGSAFHIPGIVTVPCH